MSILKIENFKYGLDVRRNELASTVGTLAGLENAHINAGGEVEKRKAFEVVVGVSFEPAGGYGETFGFEVTSAGIITFAWPSVNPVAISLPWAGMTNQVVALDPGEAGWTMNNVISSCVINDETFVIAEYINGSDETVKHLFYGTTKVATLPPDMQDPTYCMAFKNQVFVLSGQYLFGCKIGDPLTWTGESTGVTRILLGQHGTGYERYKAIKPYQDKLAVFSDLSIQVWNIDPDDANWSLSQLLNNTGLVSALSAVAIGDLDVLYLSPSGIRSLRAKESTLNAITTDIGSPIDQEILDKLAECSEAEKDAICGTAEPLSGRYWLFIKDTIYVLSYYPTLKITAWSTYSPEYLYLGATPNVFRSFSPTKFQILDHRMLFRATDDTGTGLDWIFAYGQGIESWIWGGSYDATEVSVETPWLSMDAPAAVKMIKGLDVIFNGTWSVYAKSSYRNANAEWKEVMKNVTASTPEGQYFPYMNSTTHLKLKFTSTSASRATLSSLLVHFNKGADK